MLTVSQLTKSYAGRVLFEDAALQINAGDRVGLIGPNGAGKSTLFSLILREISPDAGTISLPRGVSLGFLPQESAPSGDETVLELAMAISKSFVEVQKLLRENPDEARTSIMKPSRDMSSWTVTTLRRKPSVSLPDWPSAKVTSTDRLDRCPADGSCEPILPDCS